MTSEKTKPRRRRRQDERRAIGRWIREQRRERGWEQEALAKAWKVSQPTLSRIEAGGGPVILDRLSDLAAIFGLTMVEVVRGIYGDD